MLLTPWVRKLITSQSDMKEGVHMRGRISYQHKNHGSPIYNEYRCLPYQYVHTVCYINVNLKVIYSTFGLASILYSYVFTVKFTVHLNFMG